MGHNSEFFVHHRDHGRPQVVKRPGRHAFETIFLAQRGNPCIQPWVYRYNRPCLSAPAIESGDWLAYGRRVRFHVYTMGLDTLSKLWLISRYDRDANYLSHIQAWRDSQDNRHLHRSSAGLATKGPSGKEGQGLDEV